MTTPSGSTVLLRWNTLDAEAAAREILPCCGSRAWADGHGCAAAVCFGTAIARGLRRGVGGPARAGLARGLCQPSAHRPAARALRPRLNHSPGPARSSARPSAPDGAARLALAEGNRQYEERFGRIFIVCAAGRSAAEILAILNVRMQNTAAAELLEAAEQQRQITQLRLRRWLGVN